MKLKYETRCKAIGGGSRKAGYGGWTVYSTSAKTEAGLVKRMEEEARNALEKRVRFYEGFPAAGELDLYSEDHVWFFHTYAPLQNGAVLQFDAYAVMSAGEYSEIEFAAYANGKDGWEHYKARREHYEGLVSDGIAV